MRCEPCEEELERHTINFSAGYTFERGGGGATFGLDYDYRLDRRFGVGGFFDYVAGDVTAFAVGAALFYHPTPGLVLYLGPGADIDPEEVEEGNREVEVGFLFRLAAAYEFEIGRGFSLAPSAFVDFIAPKESAYGFTLNLVKTW